MTEQEELEYLKQNSPMALPDDPSSSGWSASQIKEKHYAGLFFLYNLFKANRQNLNQAVSDMQEIVDSINEEYEEIINGKNVSAKWDDENNEIKTTYAKILNITNGTIKVLKYIKENGTDDYIYNIEKNLSTLTTNFNTLKAWTDNLKDINSDTSVLRAVQATKDGLGNIINETYATIASLNLTSASITNIVNGTTIVGKAYNDQLGRRIDTTYIRIADIINVLNDTSTNKPLSAAMGKSLQQQINAINTLLASDDTDLDTIQEIITYIKNNKTLIENITSDKMSYSVLVHNLTTNNDNLPLSASMGYVLKGYIDTINDAETGIQANEAQRILNENQRISNEEARQTGYSGFDSRITANTNAISGIKDGTNLDSFSDVESALATKANTSDVYDKTEVYTKAEAESLINAKCKETADNLQWQLGTYDLGVDTVNGTTSLLPSPSGTIQATMVRIDGKSEVSENLIVLQDVAETTNNGITYSVSNGVLKINGTATASFGIYINSNIIPIGTYTIGAFNNVAAIGSYGIYLRNKTTSTNVPLVLLNTINSSYTVTTTIECNQLHLWFNENCSFNNIVVKPMLVKGSTAPTEFKVGYDGIHNLELSGLKVEGSNIANIPNNTLSTNGYIIAWQDLPRNFEAGNYTVSLNWTGGGAMEVQFTTNDTSVVVGRKTINSATAGRLVFAITTTSVATKIRAYASNTSGGTVSNVTVNRGSSDLGYTPYITPTTLPIDLTTIEDSGGNKLFADGSLKGNENVQDIITPTYQESAWDKYTFTGNETLTEYTRSNDNTKTYAFLVTGRVTNTNVLFTPFSKTSATVMNNMENNSYRGATDTTAVIFYSTDYQTSESMLSFLTGKTIQFERATHITSNTNLSQLVKFEAYSNGSITLVNTNNQDTTSTFKYLKEVAK